MASYYIGLMSGTSADGIDLALVDFSQTKPILVASHYTPYDQATRDTITTLYSPGDNEIDRMGELDKKLAHLFAQAVNEFLAAQQLTSEHINAIGNHGQTIRHRPGGLNSANQAFTLQIGCNQTLACLTGIPTIGKFRDKDIALGGQGAPLVPAFHQYLIDGNGKDNVIVNIGGIANITYLPQRRTERILGFDTGPGNCLLDEWFTLHHSDRNYDDSGKWAASGEIISPLLSQLLQDDYFNQSAPKSTGREIFHQNWLTCHLNGINYRPADVQATLTALTAKTIAKDIKQLTQSANIWLCGGGRLNDYLVSVISDELSGFSVQPIESLGFNGDAIEAMAFAWLAYAYKENIFSNLPAVTGAQKSTTLGVLFTP